MATRALATVCASAARLTVVTTPTPGSPGAWRALASAYWNRANAAEESPKMGELLFVQTSKGMIFDKASSKLTLTEFSPITVFFTDRPERVAGNMRTAAFVPFWSEGRLQI
jgi:hypothetical protein